MTKEKEENYRHFSIDVYINKTFLAVIIGIVILIIVLVMVR